jgi:hypothetical protein
VPPGDEKAIRGRPGAHAECRGEGVALRGRQELPAVHQRSAKLMERGEGKFHLGFGPRRARDPALGRLLYEVIQKGRLANPSLAPQNQ